MKKIVVAGSVSGAGKTSFTIRLLKNLKGWGAIKLTVCHDGNFCPRTANDECGVCSSLSKDYEVEERREIIEQAGTDTQRMKRAGAEKVLWIKTKFVHLKEAMENALERISGLEGVVIEGNHSLYCVDPDFSVMLLSPYAPIKPSALDIMDKVDVTIVANSSNSTNECIITYLHPPPSPPG